MSSASPRSSLNRITFDTTKEWNTIRRDYTNFVNKKIAEIPPDLPDSDKVIIEQRLRQVRPSLLHLLRHVHFI